MKQCHAIRALMLTFVVSTPALCQPVIPAPAETVNLSGPRFGTTFLSSGVVNKLRTDGAIDIRPFVTQFGWQFEKQFYGPRSGPTALTEWVLLVGGMEQGVMLPSVSWLVGMRMGSGTEFAIGPNVTPVGVALAFAAGTTVRKGIVNIPINVAVVPSKSGVRVSVLSGFSLRR
jgi:hypothetical protein